MSTDIKQPTNFEQLKIYAEGSVLELPGWGPDQPFIARLCRPSMLDLVQHGKIPNELLGAAEELFTGKSKPRAEKPAKSPLQEMMDIFTIFAQACLVEPTYDDLINAGLKLTDSQLIFLYNYASEGVKALMPFRPQAQVNNKPNSTGKGVQPKAEPIAGNK